MSGSASNADLSYLRHGDTEGGIGLLALMDILRFWGKAQPLDSDTGPHWHPLVFHSLDVSAVGEVLLETQEGLRRHFARLFAMPEDVTTAILSRLLALHDIGKFARRFQAKVPGRFPDCFHMDPAQLSTAFDHGTGGFRLCAHDAALLGLPSGARADIWRPLVSAATGHHGAPPHPDGQTSIASLTPDFGPQGIAAAQVFAGELDLLLPMPAEACAADRKLLRRASFAVAGLAVLADWIGSNQAWFPYGRAEDFLTLADYWRQARHNAAEAIRKASILPAGPAPRLSYDKLIGVGRTASPMQKWAKTTSLPQGPALFMVEDETGSGKTEAALMLAHRLIVSSRAEGLYIALPTMATANAMFGRLDTAYQALFSQTATPSLALVHGARDLHAGFREATLSAARWEASYGAVGGAGEEGSDIPASTMCATWIADDRRRAFLADAGAGTIDQAILSVLPSRHQSLRLLGLMQRVLILDEVHAYDAYMQREMETLLEFQAALGGSAILLSATLPAIIRHRLSDAFAKGLGTETQPETPGAAYPLATICAEGAYRSEPVAGRADRARRLPVRFLRDVDAALAAVEVAARAGRAVLYLRNTVDDAFEAHAALTARGFSPDLFHARFALTDRLAVEERIVAAFGKHSTWEIRAGRVLVATQIVEQSLDLDFDVMITDLAPVDLMIQRAGRLWRHERPERDGSPELLIVSPPAEIDAGADWYARLFPRAAFVYRDHARLWLSTRILEETGCIDSPGGLRHLIEAVYGDAVETRVPAGLAESFYTAEGNSGAERGIATTNLLSLSSGYMRAGGAWDADIRTPTRLADDVQRTLRLAHMRDGRIVPYAVIAAPDELWRAWRLSEVSISARKVTGEAVPQELAEAARRARADWTRYDDDKLLLVLEGDDADSLTGCIEGPQGIRSVSYSATAGLHKPN